MLLPWSSSLCFRSCPASPLLTYTSQPYSTSPSPPYSSSSSYASALKEKLSKLLLSPPQRKTTSFTIHLPATTTTTRPPLTPITIDRSAPVSVPISNVSYVIKSFNDSYPSNQTSNRTSKITPRKCTKPKSFSLARNRNNDPLSPPSVPAPDTLESRSNNIQLVQPYGTVDDTSSCFIAASPSTCSFPPDPVPPATFSYSNIPFLDDLQLEDEGYELEQDRDKSQRTMGYLRLRRTQKSPARRWLSIKPSPVDSAYSPSSPRLFSPSLSPSSFFAPTIPPAVHLFISRRNLPPILYESVRKIHDALVNGVQPLVKRPPSNGLDGQDPPPRSQVRDIRSNPAHYLMRATETRMIMARKLAAPLKPRAVLPRRTVSFAKCGSRLAATTWQDY